MRRIWRPAAEPAFQWDRQTASAGPLDPPPVPSLSNSREILSSAQPLTTKGATLHTTCLSTHRFATMPRPKIRITQCLPRTGDLAAPFSENKANKPLIGFVRPKMCIRQRSSAVHKTAQTLPNNPDFAAARQALATIRVRGRKRPLAGLETRRRRKGLPHMGRPLRYHIREPLALTPV